MAANLSDSESLLKKAMTDLDKAWHATGESWKDNARVEFEREHLDELRISSEGAYRAMANLEHLLRSVIRECR